VSDTPATTAALRALLLARSGDPPVAAALALRSQAGATGLAPLAELAADRALPARQRAIVLLAVSLALADEPTAAAPDAALDAVDDADVVEAAIEAGLSAAVTGVLRAAPRDAASLAARRLVGRRCLAVGIHGPHIAMLLADGGDPAGAAEAAVADLRPRLAGEPGPDTLACLHLLVIWSEDPSLPLFGDIVRRLAADDPGAPERLAILLTRLGSLGPERIARARSRIGSELARDPAADG
jgi:hypothetical protein